MTDINDVDPEFATERRFQEFKCQESIDLDKAMREIEPGQMDGFARRWADQYTERARKFLRTVSDDLKQKYDSKLFATERELFTSAAMFQRTEQKRLSLDELDKSLADFKRLLDANPFLTPIEKKLVFEAGSTEAIR